MTAPAAGNPRGGSGYAFSVAPGGVPRPPLPGHGTRTGNRSAECRMQNAECRMQSEKLNKGIAGDLTQSRHDATSGQAL